MTNIFQIPIPWELVLSGANYLVRKMAAHSNPTVDITQDGEKFSIKLHSMFVTRESSFTVGDDYEETQHNGAVMKVRTTLLEV